MARHIHCDLIKAWADGAEIQVKMGGSWSGRELLESALNLIAKYHAREAVLVDWEKSVIEAISSRLSEPEPESEARLRPSGSEAIYGFCGWLTTRSKKIVMSSTDDCAPVADAIKKYCEANGLTEPRDNYDYQLKIPKS